MDRSRASAMPSVRSMSSSREKYRSIVCIMMSVTPAAVW